MQKSRSDELHLKMTEQAELAVINDTVVILSSMLLAISSGDFDGSAPDAILNIYYT
jgi:hypothetical protein